MARNKHIKLETPEEIRRAISRVSNMLLNDELEPKVASALFYGCNVALGSIRTCDQQEKLCELERLIAAGKHKAR